MKVALFYGGQDIRVEELPDPVPGRGEVLVRVRAAGICGSDLHAYRDAERVPATPYTAGHELAGDIAALGPEVADLAVGQNVAVEPRHLTGCGHCPWCRRGDYHLCPERGRVGGHRVHSTGFAEYSLEPADKIYPLPDHVPLEQAAILDVYACGVHALHLAPAKIDDTVVVQGTGAIGLGATELYKLGGAGRVIVCGVSPGALQAALRIGADAVINTSEVDPVSAVMDLTHGHGADLVVEAVGGVAPTFTPDLQMAARGGTVLLIGVFTRPQALDMGEGMRKELRLVFSNSYALWHGVPEFKIALDLLAAGKLKADQYITHRVPLEHIAEGFALAASKRASGALKVIVKP